MESVSSGFDVLLNLAKYDKSREILVENHKLLSTTVLDVLKMYRDKCPEIFSKGCSIIWTLAHSEVVRKVRMRFQRNQPMDFKTNFYRIFFFFFFVAACQNRARETPPGTLWRFVSKAQQAGSGEKEAILFHHDEEDLKVQPREKTEDP